ncbi:MAG TPA: hypothetical protein VND64_20490 [Pirellulales bacterium]|nr:hypothetical protein [Pirellulales bacterium]
MNLPLVYRPEVRDEVDGAHAWYEKRSCGAIATIPVRGLLPD